MKILLLTAVLSLSACGIINERSQASLQSAIEKAPYEVIIVPGVPHDGNTWQTTMQMRVLWSNYLYKNGLTSNVLYSGSAVYSPYCEAEIMASYGAAMGIPSAAIYVDTNAEHSTENVYYSYRIARAAGFTKIALATDPFQSKSLKKFIKKMQLPIDVIPVVFDTLTMLDHTEPKIDPSLSLRPNFISVKDREGFFKRLGGTFGKHIIWYKSDVPTEKLIRKFERKGRLIDDSPI